MNQIDRYQKEDMKKVMGLIKDDLGGKNMTKFVGLRAKIYRYLIDGASEDKKTKGYNKMFHKNKT